MTWEEAQTKFQSAIDELLADGWEVWGWDTGEIVGWNPETKESFTTPSTMGRVRGDKANGLH